MNATKLEKHIYADPIEQKKLYTVI